MDAKELVVKLGQEDSEPWHVVVFEGWRNHGGHAACSSAYTRCGLDIPMPFRFFDEGAPDEPTCPGCQDVLDPDGLFERIAQHLKKGTPVTAQVGSLGPEAIRASIRYEQALLHLRAYTGWDDDLARQRVRAMAAEDKLTHEEAAWRLMARAALVG